MLKTLNAHQPSNPQAAEFHAEHPQVPALPPDPNQADTGDFLVVSPYTSLPHLLDLKTLDTPQQLLAKALIALSPIREDYATAPYIDSFNWESIITKLRKLAQDISHQWRSQHFYIVVFRSQVPPTTDRIELGELDERSHVEATKSGGLLKYWFGTPDQNGRNLATCLWRHPLDARPASVGPGHKAAARATTTLYSEWKIERLKLEIGDGVQEWRIGDWED